MRKVLVLNKGLEVGAGERPYIPASVLGGEVYLNREAKTIENPYLVKLPYLFVRSYCGYGLPSEVLKALSYTAITDEIKKEVVALIARANRKPIAVFVEPSGKLIAKFLGVLFAELDDENSDLVKMAEYKGKISEELKNFFNYERVKQIGEYLTTYAGAVIGQKGDEIIIFPCSVYKASQTVPAFTPEGDEINAEIKELESKIVKLETEGGNENEIRELKARVNALKRKLYTPDIKLAIQKKLVDGDEIVLISKKSEVRYLGENLCDVGNYEDYDRGVFAYITYPVVNPTKNEISKGGFAVALSLANDSGMVVLAISKARQFLGTLRQKLAKALRDINEGREPKIDTSDVNNASLEKRLSDFENYLKSLKKEEATEKLQGILRELNESLTYLYSPYTISEVITRNEILGLLSELKAEPETHEDWEFFNMIYEQLNKKVEQDLSANKKLSSLIEKLYKFVKEGKPIKFKRKDGSIGYFPDENKAGLEYYHLENFRRTIVIPLIKKGFELPELSFLFKDEEIAIPEDIVEKAVARFILKTLAEKELSEMPVSLEEALKIAEDLKARWRGEYVSSSTRKISSDVEEIFLEEDDELDLF
jgi:hypothetical protein